MQKEKNPDDRHYVLQIKEIKLQSKIVHTGEGEKECQDTPFKD